MKKNNKKKSIVSAFALICWKKNNFYSFNNSDFRVCTKLNQVRKLNLPSKHYAKISQKSPAHKSRWVLNYFLVYTLLRSNGNRNNSPDTDCVGASASNIKGATITEAARKKEGKQIVDAISTLINNTHLYRTN